MDATAFFKIGYGLYIVTTRDAAGRDNGMICNTVMQLTAEPPRIAVAINKANLSHATAKETRVLNVCALSEEAPFAVFERFGFKSGRDSDKFDGFASTRSSNGLAVPGKYCTALFELAVADYIDLGTHGMFICDVKNAETLGAGATMSYAYYHANVKPKPAVAPAAPGGAAKWVCKICGYVYDPAENGGVAFEDLPDDWLCPWCKHPKSDFEKA